MGWQKGYSGKPQRFSGPLSHAMDCFVLDEQPETFLVRRRCPVCDYGGQFLFEMEKAFNEGRIIEVTKGQDNASWHIRFRVNDKIFKGVVDPGCGYSLIQWEIIKNNVVIKHYSASFEQINKGIWFPTKARSESFFDDGQTDGFSDVIFKDIIVNDPHINDESFRIELPAGSEVYDKAGKKRYVIPDQTHHNHSSSVKTINCGTEYSLARNLLLQVGAQEVASHTDPPVEGLSNVEFILPDGRHYSFSVYDEIKIIRCIAVLSKPDPNRPGQFWPVHSIEL